MAEATGRNLMGIAVRKLHKQYGSFTALDNVSVEVPDGSLTALLGPSGSGKSTLLRVIAGLEQPDAGEVVVAGARATHIPARNPPQLSGGQRQRMALARALAVQPRVLLLDEPFGALDANVRADLRAWLRRLHEEVAVTTVLVTHDQEEAMEVADNLAVLREGRIEQVGAPRDIYERPVNAFVMSFIGPVADLDGRLVRPHDLQLSDRPEDGSEEAMILRVVHLGFQVR